MFFPIFFNHVLGGKERDSFVLLSSSCFLVIIVNTLEDVHIFIVLLMNFDRFFSARISQPGRPRHFLDREYCYALLVSIRGQQCPHLTAIKNTYTLYQF